MPEEKKDKRNRDEDDTETAEHGHGPVDAEIVELPKISQPLQILKQLRSKNPTHHRSREHREPRTQPATKERVRRDRRVCVLLVDIDDIIEALHENEQHTAADGDAGDDLRPRRDGGVVRPSEPEHADGQDDGADAHGHEARLGNHVAFFFEGVLEAVFGRVDDDQDADDDAYADADEGQAADAFVVAAGLLEGDWVGFEGQVEESWGWG